MPAICPVKMVLIRSPQKNRFSPFSNPFPGYNRSNKPEGWIDSYLNVFRAFFDSSLPGFRATDF